MEFETVSGRRLRIGPRHIELLAAVGRYGSISAAARHLGVSFRGAWLMIETMERGLGCEVLTRTVGGEGGGGATVNPCGAALLKLLDDVEGKLRDDLAALLEQA